MNVAVIKGNKLKFLENPKDVGYGETFCFIDSGNMDHQHRRFKIDAFYAMPHTERHRHKYFEKAEEVFQRVCSGGAV